MILDRGIATIYTQQNAAAPGDKPQYTNVLLTAGYYGELDFATDSAKPTEDRKEVRVDQKIRMLQDRRITAVCVAALADACDIVPGLTVRYKVVRVWHGMDKDSGQPISDISLQEVGVW